MVRAASGGLQVRGCQFRQQWCCPWECIKCCIYPLHCHSQPQNIRGRGTLDRGRACTYEIWAGFLLIVAHMCRQRGRRWYRPMLAHSALSEPLQMPEPAHQQCQPGEWCPSQWCQPREWYPSQVAFSSNSQVYDLFWVSQDQRSHFRLWLDWGLEEPLNAWRQNSKQSFTAQHLDIAKIKFQKSGVDEESLLWLLCFVIIGTDEE